MFELVTTGEPAGSDGEISSEIVFIVRWCALVSVGAPWCPLCLVIDRFWCSELSQPGGTLAAMDAEDHAMVDALGRHVRRHELDDFMA